MATAFFLWSSPSPAKEMRSEDVSLKTNVLLPDQDATEENKVQQNQRPKAQKRRKKKQVEQKNKAPQRGLGVAQLEKLRLQERWKKMTEIDGVCHLQHGSGAPGNGAGGNGVLQYNHQVQQPLQLHLPAFDYCGHGGGGAGTYSLTGRFGASSVGYGVPWAESCFLQRHSMGNPAYPGGGAVPGVQSLSLDRIRIASPAGMAGEGRYPVGSPFPELSSNQKLQCTSDHCELCIKAAVVLQKKQVYGIGENMAYMGNGHRSEKKDFFYAENNASICSDEEMGFDPYVRKGMEYCSEVKEYELFPCNRSGSNVVNGDASSTFPSSSYSPTSYVDLSLRL